MSEWEESQFQLVEPGERYNLRIVDANEGRSGAGNKVMDMDFVVVGGPFDGVSLDKKCPGWIVSIIAKALGFAKRQRKDGKFVYDVDGKDLRGKYVNVTVNHREYENKFYNDISTDFTAADATVIAVTPSKAKPEAEEDGTPF